MHQTVNVIPMWPQGVCKGWVQAQTTIWTSLALQFSAVKNEREAKTPGFSRCVSFCMLCVSCHILSRHLCLLSQFVLHCPLGNMNSMQKRLRRLHGEGARTQPSVEELAESREDAAKEWGHGDDTWNSSVKRWSNETKRLHLHPVSLTCQHVWTVMELFGIDFGRSTVVSVCLLIFKARTHLRGREDSKRKRARRAETNWEGAV